MANRGEKHHSAKLTEAKVRAMRYLFWVRNIDCRCLTKFYNISIGNCWDVCNYTTWKHVVDSFSTKQITRSLKSKCVTTTNSK